MLTCSLYPFYIYLDLKNRPSLSIMKYVCFLHFISLWYQDPSIVKKKSFVFFPTLFLSSLYQDPYQQSMEHHTDWVNDAVLCCDGKTCKSIPVHGWVVQCIALKPMDTFGKQYCPRPTLRVSQLTYKITNLWKFRLNWSSESGENNGETHPCFRTFRRVMTCV